ncbi:MAG: DNA-formamidopyrimidine glycosylase [Geobacteraceae bacterium]|nr:DNA-formamidopyrimidine glycosylase [Geobacteraceae bacterium]
MPELPEVESVVRVLRDGVPTLVGLRIVTVNVAWDGVLSDANGDLDVAELEGCGFISVARHGKYLIFHLECPRKPSRDLIIHLRMTGRLFLVPHNEALARHTRLVLMLNNGLALRFDDPRKFGRAWLVDDAATIIGRLGPDALKLDPAEFCARLARHRRQLKPLLLDQSCVAGIGNIYADESLFRAGLHPQAISSELASDEIRRLHSAITSVLEEAVEAQGANIDGVFKAGRFAVSVYGRQGAPCRVCGSEIRKIRVGQRGTHYCPECQVLSPGDVPHPET